MSTDLSHLHKRRIVGQAVAIVAILLFSLFLLFKTLRQNRDNQELEGELLVTSAHRQLTDIATRLAKFALVNKRLPNSLDETMTANEFTDPWGTSIRYEILQFQTGELRLTSAGSDRKFGTADDIVFHSSPQSGSSK